VCETVKLERTVPQRGRSEKKDRGEEKKLKGELMNRKREAD
jgi:hypothetical protein